MHPAYYMGDHTMLTQLAHGPKIYVDTRDVSLAPHIIWSGMWEQWVTDVFLRTVKPGDVFFDIGANCGYYSLLATMCGATVHAFEPNPIHHLNITHSFAINGYNNAHLHKVALADVAHTVTLTIPDQYTGSASVVDNDMGDYSMTHVDVPAVVLDEYLPGVRPDVVKIDIEGSEPLIVDSLFRVLKPDTRIIMEYAPQRWRNHNYDPASILARFVSAGYKLNVIEYTGNTRASSVDELVDVAEYVDLYIAR